MTAMRANVLVCRGVGEWFDYLIPDTMAVKEGDRVRVPFGKQLVEGIVMGVSPVEASPSPYPLKPIDSTLSFPLSGHQRELIIHMMGHYLTTPYKAYQTVVGSAKRRKTSPLPPLDTLDTPLPLSDDQSAAVAAVLACKGGDAVVLHGVTGSGKTEVYMQLVAHFLSRGDGVIVLVPEIALTPQLSRLFMGRFGETVAVLHSGLTPKQRGEALSRIEAGGCRVVIGPRSAVFSDMPNLGLVIVDECHDSSYKQDAHPRYDALSIAHFRARVLGIPLVLGSATPTLEQWVSSATRVSMPHRVANRPMPRMHLLDMTDRVLFPDHHVIGKPLLDAIRVALSRDEKCMVLVNRRGYAPTVSCGWCKKVLNCEGCGLPLTYHADRNVRCHRCMVRFPLPPTCPSCNRSRLETSGAAIQKVTIELAKTIPTARILRLDRDTASTHGKMMGILDAFRDAGDILVGTQMIAKGHDIPAVTVVGLVGIDTALGIPDFRARERAFQLVLQVAGRAGRGDKGGDVYIQTTRPDDETLKWAVAYDIPTFMDREWAFRQALYYPPHCRLINIMASGLELEVVREQLGVIYAALTAQPGNHRVYPPAPSPVDMIKRHHRWHVLVKTTDDGMGDMVAVLRSVPGHKKVRVIVDVDPQSIV